jgi:hypothetical protein
MSWTSRNFAKQYINHYSRKDTNHHIKGSDTAANRRTLVVVPHSVVIDDRLGSGRIDLFTTLVDTELDLNTAANWDSIATDYTVEATRAGKDFYYYDCMQPGTIPKILLSSNSTYPSGYTANNSRKIGGFHCLCLDVGTIASHPLTGFLTGDILPRSIWDLLHRSAGAQAGMVWAGSSPSDTRKGPPIWVAIYLASGTGETTASVFGGTITVSRTWPDFVDDFAAIGCRMLRDHEFQSIAAGSNEESKISTGVAPATTGGHVDTNTRRMVSDIGCEDCCGTLLQWIAETGYQLGGVKNHTHDVVVSGDPETVTTGNPSVDISPDFATVDPGGSKGTYTAQGTYGEVAVKAGGLFNNGSGSGSRARDFSSRRFQVSSVNTSRFCASSVHLTS